MVETSDIQHTGERERNVDSDESIGAHKASEDYNPSMLISSGKEET
jgi:hypothetical protein